MYIQPGQTSLRFLAMNYSSTFQQQFYVTVLVCTALIFQSHRAFSCVDTMADLGPASTRQLLEKCNFGSAQACERVLSIPNTQCAYHKTAALSLYYLRIKGCQLGYYEFCAGLSRESVNPAIRDLIPGWTKKANLPGLPDLPIPLGYRSAATTGTLTGVSDALIGMLYAFIPPLVLIGLFMLFLGQYRRNS